jgi:predicted HicB family RNase H-like nuclease
MKGFKRKTAYLQIRITPEFLEILKAEATVAEQSLSEYIHHILVYRKRTRIAIPIQGGRYLGY